MALTDDQKKLNDELEREARLRKEISESLTEYVKAVKDSKKLAKEIADLEAKKTAEATKLADMQNGIILATAVEIQKQQDLVDVLEHQNEVLKDNKRILDKTIGSVNKYQLASQRAFVKGGAQMVKTFLNLDNIIENAYGKLKSFGLFEMDKAMKNTALSMGLAGKQSEILRSSIKGAAMNTTMFGAGIEELAKYQAEYSEELGRSVMLGEKGLGAIAEMAKGTTLGAEGAAKMAADFELQGISAERTRDFVEDAVNKSAKMGLNSSKVIKNMQQNMKLLNRYNFKGGVKGLQKMAETTTKLGVDMNFATGMAEKLFDIEGAVEMSAQLQVLGGSWASLGDPFKLMYMARNDMAGLTEEVAKAAASTAKFNSETGEFDISAMEMQRLRKVAEATGMEFESLVTASKNAAKFTKIKKQMSFAVDKDTKEFIENTAKMDEKGKAYIEVKGEKKFINELSKEQIKTMMGEKESLKERAEQARTFDETLTNTINMFKQSLLPFVESLEPLIKGFDNFVNQAKTDGWFTKIKEFASSVGSIVATVGKLILENPLGAFITYGIFKAASWFASGISLGLGFNSVASVGSSGGPSGGMGTRSMAAMNRAGMSTMGKFGANFKGAAGSSFTKLGGVAAGGLSAYSEFGEQTEKGKSTGEALARAGLKGAGAGAGAWGGAAAGAALGAFGGPLAPITVPLGALIGGGLGAWGGGELLDLDNWGVKDGLFGRGRNRAIMQGGKITPIDNKDDILAMKPGGMVDKMMAQNTGVNNIKHEFGEIRINGKLEVTSPGNSNVAVDLMRDPQFIRELQIKISQDLIMKENQVVKKG